MPKVTIIIPVLNVGPYIRECLDSVIGQTLTDLEIFCIDAGSTDGTLETEQEYARKDSRITILKDDARSTGYAKNLGVRLARSDYVAIVESDDYIAPDMMEKLYDTAVAYDLDMVKANYRSFLGEGADRLFAEKAVSLHPKDYGKVIDPRTDNRYFAWDMYTWTGLYKKKFLETFHIVHNETKGAAFQDVGFWFQTFCYARRIYLLKDYFYHYRRDNPNASVNNPNRTFVMCGEYEFIRARLAGDKETWCRVLPAYYHEMFRSYFVTYERLADRLKADFAARFYREMQEGSAQGNIHRNLFDPYEGEYLDALLTSGEQFAEKLRRQKAKAGNRRQAFYDSVKKYAHCMIFSAGSHGTNLQIMLKTVFGKEITAFCDNSPEKQGKTINGAVVLPPEEAVRQFPEAVYVIANKQHGGEIACQLTELGIETDRIIPCRIEELIDGFM